MTDNEFLNKEARILAKNLHKMKIGSLTKDNVVDDMLQTGFTQPEVDIILTIIFEDPEYYPESHHYYDGPGLGANALFDEAVNDEAIKVFLRIHNDIK